MRVKKILTKECMYNPEIYSKVIFYVKEELEPDILLPPLDLTIEAEVLGATVDYPNYDPPRIIKKVSLDEVRIRGEGRIPLMLNAARKSRKDKPLGFYITGPFTVLGQVIGVDALLLNLMKKDKIIKSHLEEITQLSIEYSRKLLKAGVDFIIMAEPVSSLISPTYFKVFSKPFIEEILYKTKAPVILHICGKSKHLIKEVSDLNLLGISIDQNVPLEEALQKLPENILVFGNYNPVNLVFQKPDEIKENVRKMLEPVINYRNVVASTGCDTPSTTPLENIKAFINGSRSILRKCS
ncbi:MAG: uroporphyrinogen decarboxylase family protein [Saccharolobus sp.]|uniref:uroporphyrinogen decarboxylase family protein n=1 Tax=Saccharolobus sp. TaxID=2100761 RepID=UPI00317D5A00